MKKTIILLLTVITITSCARPTCKYYKESIEKHKDKIFMLQIDFDMGRLDYDEYKYQLKQNEDGMNTSKHNYEYNKCKN